MPTKFLFKSKHYNSSNSFVYISYDTIMLTSVKYYIYKSKQSNNLHKTISGKTLVDVTALGGKDHLLPFLTFLISFY